MSQPPAEHGVLATTRYVPRLRLERSEVLAQHRWMAPGLRALAKGRRAIASWDEDSVTMAVEAGRQLQRALPAATAVELTLASTTLPFAERLNAGIVAAALGLAPDAVLRDVASSARAALTELAAALRRPAGNGAQLLLAAERRIARPASAQEMIFGDGAAGALVGTGAAIATLVASRSTHADLVDHFRESGQHHDYGWEERWVRDEGYMKIAAGTIRDCLSDAGVIRGRRGALRDAGAARARERRGGEAGRYRRRRAGVGRTRDGGRPRQRAAARHARHRAARRGARRADPGGRFR